MFRNDRHVALSILRSMCLLKKTLCKTKTHTQPPQPNFQVLSVTSACELAWSSLGDYWSGSWRVGTIWGGGGATPRGWTPTTPPPTHRWPEAPQGGGVWKGRRRGVWEGQLGGGGGRVRVRTRLRAGVGVWFRVGFRDSVGVQSGQKFPLGAFGALGALGAFSAHGLLSLVPLTTHCCLEAPWGGREGVLGAGLAESPPPPMGGGGP